MISMPMNDVLNEFVRFGKINLFFLKNYQNDRNFIFIGAIQFISLGEEPIAGKQQVTINHMLMLIPDSIEGRPVKEGHYHFIVYCTDSSGQESFIAREIEIAYNAGEHLH